MEQNVRRLKRKINAPPPNPQTLYDIVIPAEQQMTRTNPSQPYILIDTGPTDPHRIICFCSPDDLRRLIQWFCVSYRIRTFSTVLLIDATFDVAPKLYRELWVIHGRYNGNKVLPFAFFLLPDKSEATYRRALQILIEKMEEVDPGFIRPAYIVIDFEKAEENAIRALFPNATIHGCTLHFSKAVYRWISENGLKNLYLNDTPFRIAIKKFVALCFCEPADVMGRFNNLGIDFMQAYGNEPNSARFIDYFEENWVGRINRPPRYPIAMWNSKSATELDLPRTNNAVEAWNGAFPKALSGSNPTIFKLIDALLEENCRVNMLAIKIDNGQQYPLYASVKHRQENERLKALMIQYLTKTADDYLDACVHYVLND